MILTGLALWMLAGVGAGLIIGLAGAGGGIVGIPILMYFGDMSFRVASGYSLIIVTFGALFSWYTQREFTRFRISLIIVSTSTVVSYIVAQYKSIIPGWFDILVLWGVCLFGLYRIWTLSIDSMKVSPNEESYKFKEYVLAAICGVVLGALVTLIGVGGGLVTVPFLLVVMRLPMKEAIATDIFSILLVAPFSAWAQGRFDISFEDLAGLVAGVALAAIVFTQLRKLLSLEQLKIVRKLALSLAIVLALLSSILKGPASETLLNEFHATTSYLEYRKI